MSRLTVDMNPEVVYEYSSASNPAMSEVPVRVHPASLHQAGGTRVVPFDLSAALGVPYPATSPNLLVSFVRILHDTSIDTTAVATSQVFYVIRGQGETTIRQEEAKGGEEDGEEAATVSIQWKQGDLLAIPYTPGQVLRHTAADVEVEHGGAALYWIHDAPLLSYLRVAPTAPAFRATHFTADFLLQRVQKLRHDPEQEGKNRLGILVANEDTKDETKTLTHVLWSLLNVLPGKTTQPPHRHNSVALDLCISAPGGGRVYTAMSKTLLQDGSLLEPVTVSWESGSAFVTPPGWWHSHVNEAEGDAWVLPLQDAGLVTHQRILDIRFAPDEVQQLKHGRLTGISLNYHVPKVGAGAN